MGAQGLGAGRVFSGSAWGCAARLSEPPASRPSPAQRLGLSAYKHYTVPYHTPWLERVYHQSLLIQARKDVEGSLFLVKRRAQPRFQFVILNKKSAGGWRRLSFLAFPCLWCTPKLSS